MRKRLYQVHTAYIHLDQHLSVPGAVHQRFNKTSEHMLMMMMGLLSSSGFTGNSSHDETLQYLIILGSKVTLNTLVLLFWTSGLHRSLLGIFSISMYVADVMLASSVFYVWHFIESTSSSMCFILAHASTVYAILPLPILVAGALDYATYPVPVAGRSRQRRTVVYCITAALLWASACMCSYRYTDAHPIEIHKDVKILACRVHGATVVSHFCAELSVVVGVVLLLHQKNLIGWIRRAHQMWDCAVLEKGRLASYGPLVEGGDSPSLFVGLTLVFAVTWMPYLIISVAFDLVGLAVPAYASINLLWMACANSALAGTAIWCQSDRAGPFLNVPDDICLWDVYWHLSKSFESVSTVHLSDATRMNKTTPAVYNI
ncbi:probable G-protein coupled receptor 160 isoform X2 [Triplophysa dalaica]|uniref:probable G-protein coupled receptor 160 isoform X2 n=1 Tax=Triplophysa dalaica TaxID=1582913 RepID=UPI0024E0224A|nr:probable G-protein coupled receptor 160 isoform X2 [Triplophysa dalaica]